MFNQVSSCPKCGAPIYVETPWMAVTPPPTIYSCECRKAKIAVQDSTTNPVDINTPQPAERCNHCYCTPVAGTSCKLPHNKCCKCGDVRKIDGIAYTSWKPTLGGDSTSMKLPSDYMPFNKSANSGQFLNYLANNAGTDWSDSTLEWKFDADDDEPDFGMWARLKR